MAGLWRQILFYEDVLFLYANSSSLGRNCTSHNCYTGLAFALQTNSTKGANQGIVSESKRTYDAAPSFEGAFEGRLLPHLIVTL